MFYFFIGGSHPALSAAEITAVFPGARGHYIPLKPAGSQTLAILLKPPGEIDANALIRRLGGTIKIGRLPEAGPLKRQDLLPAIVRLIAADRPGPSAPGAERTGGHKFNFGLSYYGNRNFEIKPLAMAVKKELRARGRSSRWVTSREPVLSSVVVEQNRLLKDGAEIVLVESGQNFYLGRTLAVQPFKELSFRDYGRPARDDRSGMLPPKLAQIMINLALPLSGSEQDHAYLRKAVILDPFCGSGTILSEAMLMGYENLIGTDISPRAIADTEKNLSWLKSSHELRVKSYKLKVADATHLSSSVASGSIDAIVTEPYLGPQRGRPDIAQTANELSRLYSLALAEFRKTLKPSGRVVMVWPVFILKNKKYPISPDIAGFKIINPVPADYREIKNAEVAARSALLYGRSGQRVWREIVVLTKI